MICNLSSKIIIGAVYEPREWGIGFTTTYHDEIFLMFNEVFSIYFWIGPFTLSFIVKGKEEIK